MSSNSAPDSASRCRLCEETGTSAVLTVREMMFGSRETFDYQQCTSCGSLQIATVPGDLAKYYPENYYSMSDTERGPVSLKTRIKERLVHELHRVHALNLGPLEKLLPAPRRPDYAGLIAAGATKRDRILDVGCGSRARFLRFLSDLGFSDLTGADPFISDEVLQFDGVRVVRRYLAEIDDQYDVVTLNHSFEHVPEPHAQMQQVARILKPGGRAVIRLPTVSSNAFETYGVDWVQLDAPRHLNLPSRKAMRLMIRDAGMTLVRSYDDSNDLQFRGSELYRRDIPLMSPAANDAFSAAELAAFRRRAVECNRLERGDQATFVALKK